MFNRRKFNRSKFNITSEKKSMIFGTSIMNISTKPVKTVKCISPKGIALLKMTTKSIGTIVISNSGKVGIKIFEDFIPTLVKYLNSDEQIIKMTSEAEQTIGDEQTIHLEGLVLKPGDELVINTTDMTVTLNGVNAMKYFSDDSEFFDLLSGNNSIIYKDGNNSRNIQFDVIWKDRWL